MSVASPGEQEELKTQILGHLAPEMEERAGFCFRFSYSFEACELVTKQTYCAAPPPRTADDWSESVSRIPLQAINPDRVMIGPNNVYLFAAGDQRILPVRQRWLGVVAEGRPLEVRSLGEFHAYFARSRDEREELAEKFRRLVLLCGGSSVPVQREFQPLAKNVQALEMGMSYDQVVQRLGVPKTDIRKVKEQILFYEADPKKDPRVTSFQVAILKFVEDRLVSREIK